MPKGVYMRRYFLYFFCTFIYMALPVHSQKRPDSQQLKAWQNFNKKYNDRWQVQWEELTGAPATISGHRTVADPEIKSKGGEHVARKMLNNLKEIIKTSTRGGWKKSAETSLQTWRYIHFQQMQDDIPVYGGGYTLTVHDDGSINYISGHAFSDIVTPSPDRRINSESAKSRLLQQTPNNRPNNVGRT